ncbi:peptide chain release factor family protein [Pirellulaceae bacterium SH449]
MTHPAFLPEELILRECKTAFRRASGPGGQNRNKVETGVALIHVPTSVESQATEFRTQGENRKLALKRLRILLAIRVRSQSSEEGGVCVRRYVAKERLAISESNWDWPAVLAELLNRISEHAWQIAPVAAEFGTTSTQILKGLARESQALRSLNENRQAVGLPELKI